MVKVNYYSQADLQWHLVDTSRRLVLSQKMVFLLIKSLSFMINEIIMVLSYSFIILLSLFFNDEICQITVIAISLSLSDYQTPSIGPMI